MPYPNHTIPNNEGTADETSLLFRPDVADETVTTTTTTTTTRKPHPSRAVVAGGVAGVLLLAIAGGYYTFDTSAAPAPASASASGALSIKHIYYPTDEDGTCFAPPDPDRGDSFLGVSLHAFKQDDFFQTCYADGSSTTNTRCWSNSYYFESHELAPINWLLDVWGVLNGWYECEPAGDAWVATDPLPDGSCGLPCTTFRCADCDEMINPTNCCVIDYGPKPGQAMEFT